MFADIATNAINITFNIPFNMNFIWTSFDFLGLKANSIHSVNAWKLNKTHHSSWNTKVLYSTMIKHIVRYVSDYQCPKCHEKWFQVNSQDRQSAKCPRCPSHSTPIKQVCMPILLFEKKVNKQISIFVQIKTVSGPSC